MGTAAVELGSVPLELLAIEAFLLGKGKSWEQFFLPLFFKTGTEDEGPGIVLKNALWISPGTCNYLVEVVAGMEDVGVYFDFWMWG